MDQFAPWNSRHTVELDRIVIPSGHLAIRDVYDLDRPQVIISVTPGNYRVWSSEVSGRPAYLSIQLSAAEHVRVAPIGQTVSVDLGMILVHDAESVSPNDLESLDESWESVWNDPGNYARVNTARGAGITLCKSAFERTACPILASYDSAGGLVAVHVDFRMETAPLPDNRTPERIARTLGTAVGRARRWWRKGP